MNSATSTGDAAPPELSEIVIVVPLLIGSRLFASSRAQRILRIAGNRFVTFGERDQLLAADDVVDCGKRLVVGALIHLAQDGIGRIGTIGQNDPRGGFQSLLFVSG